MDLFVEMEVNDFDLLASFESQAQKIMLKHGGQIVAAYELSRNCKGRGVELHIVRFETAEGFDKYKNDPDLAELSSLRNRAIKSTKVSPISRVKSYS